MRKIGLKQNIRNDEYEYCVLCGAKTQYKRSEPIQNRIGYEIGVGQLCEHCNRRMELEELVAEQNKRLQRMNIETGG